MCAASGNYMSLHALEIFHQFYNSFHMLHIHSSQTIGGTSRTTHLSCFPFYILQYILIFMSFLKIFGYHLMYSSQRKRRHLSLSNVDDALYILPVASEWLLEEGIQACIKYLAAVSWTPQQNLRIQDLQSSFKVIVSTDLTERLKISKSVFDKELEKLRSILPQMLSPILNKPFVSNGVPLQHMQETVKRHLVAYF